MSRAYTVWYSASDGSDRFPCRTSWEINAYLWIAEDCADDYHSNHDGWESSWPLNITLYETEDGPAIAEFIVERESQPVFYASKAKGLLP